MIIKEKKYRKILTIGLASFILILLFEIIPGYLNLLDKTYDLAVQMIYEDSEQRLIHKLNRLQKKNTELKRKFVQGLDNDSGNSSFMLTKYSSIPEGFNLKIDLIKPLKNFQKGRMNFQRLNINLSGNYEGIYNYCRWMEYQGLAAELRELKITRNEEMKNLSVSLFIDLLQTGRPD